jgi:hypothetical protein
MRGRSASALRKDDGILDRALALGFRLPVAEATIFSRCFFRWTKVQLPPLKQGAPTGKASSSTGPAGQAVVKMMPVPTYKRSAVRAGQARPKNAFFCFLVLRRRAPSNLRHRRHFHVRLPAGPVLPKPITSGCFVRQLYDAILAIPSDSEARWPRSPFASRTKL